MPSERVSQALRKRPGQEAVTEEARPTVCVHANERMIRGPSASGFSPVSRAAFIGMGDGLIPSADGLRRRRILERGLVARRDTPCAGWPAAWLLQPAGAEGLRGPRVFWQVVDRKSTRIAEGCLQWGGKDPNGPLLEFRTGLLLFRGLLRVAF